MFGLTQLGIVHTAISLVAVGAAAVALLRDGRITWRNTVGKWYVITTVLTCLTGFGIFQHGGFGKAHVLGVATLVVLAGAALAGHTRLFGRWSVYLETIAYSTTVFFHMIPAFTEGATRLPPGAPLAANDQSPGLQMAIGAVAVIYLIGVTWQVLKLRRERRGVMPGGAFAQVP